MCVHIFVCATSLGHLLSFFLDDIALLLLLTETKSRKSKRVRSKNYLKNLLFQIYNYSSYIGSSLMQPKDIFSFFLIIISIYYLIIPMSDSIYQVSTDVLIEPPSLDEILHN